MGSVAGDDTVLLVCRSGSGGPALARRLITLAESGVEAHSAPDPPDRTVFEENK